MNILSVSVLAYLCFLCGFVSGDAQCTAAGGICQYASQTSCSGSYQAGLCSGSVDRKCCITNGDGGCTSIGGTCQYTSTSCSGTYQSNLCSGSSTRKCCVSSTGDEACTNNGNVCQYTTSAYCDGTYQSGMCSGSSSRKCCILRTSSGSCSGSAAACGILALHNSGDITLQNQHPSGVNDGAFPLLNIQDACNGEESERSSYSCGECSAWPSPGGSVCIDNRILTFIEDIAELHSVTITSITGACHSCNSKHYRGMAVDVRRNGPYSSYVTKCNQLGGLGIDEGTHIHCQFS